MKMRRVLAKDVVDFRLRRGFLVEGNPYPPSTNFEFSVLQQHGTIEESGVDLSRNQCENPWPNGTQSVQSSGFMETGLTNFTQFVRAIHSSFRSVQSNTLHLTGEENTHQCVNPRCAPAQSIFSETFASSEAVLRTARPC